MINYYYNLVLAAINSTNNNSDKLDNVLVLVKFNEKWGLSVEVGLLLIILSIVLIVIILLMNSSLLGKKIKKIFSSPKDIEGEISLGGIGKVKIKANHEVRQIAYKAWIEFTTRKAALQFEPGNDVIIEVYNSWNSLFGIIRDLTKQIPATQLDDENTKKLRDTLINGLNKGMRPHLTAWQAKFRRWYTFEIGKEENQDKTPQQIQECYEQYDVLVTDMKKINNELMEYANFLKRVAENKESND
jgi:Flp pilus assembly pilin Flp